MKPRIKKSETGLMPRQFSALENALPSWLPSRRWFGGKSRTIRHASIRDAIPLNDACYTAFLLIVHVSYRSGSPEQYLLPVSSLPVPDPSAVIVRQEKLTWSECVSDTRFWSLLLSIIAKRQKMHGAQGSISGVKSGPWAAINPPPRPSGAEQSNSSAVFGNSLFLKLYRKLSDGTNPEVEILSALAAKHPFPRVAPYRGGIEYRSPDGKRFSVGILLRYYTDSADAWQWALGAMSSFAKKSGRRPGPSLGQSVADSFALLGKRTAELHLALASLRGNQFRPEPFTSRDMNSLRRSILDGIKTIRPLVSGQKQTEETTDYADWYGRIKKSLLWEGHPCPDLNCIHTIIGAAIQANQSCGSGVCPIPKSSSGPAAIQASQACGSDIPVAIQANQSCGSDIPVAIQASQACGSDIPVAIQANQVCGSGVPAAIQASQACGSGVCPIPKSSSGPAAIQACGMKTRLHGDYHLGQVLRHKGDFIIIDFEGEPARTPEERRQKQSPLKDVAGMIRSFHYAASAHYLLARGRMSPSEEKTADLWANAAGEIFLSTYLKRMGKNCPILPSDPTMTLALLRAFVLDKALYELAYELNHRPAWSSIPLRGLASLLDKSRLML